MKIEDKLTYIHRWTNEHYEDANNNLNPETDPKLFSVIEELIEEKLPEDFTTLYTKYNGEIGEDHGVVFRLELLSLESIVRELKYAKSYPLGELEDVVSYPEKAVKLGYYHYKWLPFLTDGCGNYISVDFDPNTNEKKGQVIIHGADERVLPVIADSLSSFLDLCIKGINEFSKELLSQNHIHEILKYIAGSPNEFQTKWL